MGLSSFSPSGATDMLESDAESEGNENIVSNVDLSLVSVDRWTCICAAVSSSSDRTTRMDAHPEQGVFDQ